MSVLPEDPLEPYYFEHEDQEICGKLVTPITDSYREDYPTVVDRFFTRFYYFKGDVPYQVLYHSNRICLICLAPDHPALSQGISSVNFDIGNVDRSQNVVKGKGKKGGMILQAESTLALLTTDNGDTYKVPSCIRGKLVEVNTALVEEPKLLEHLPEGAGYFAILLPKIENCDAIKASLLTQEQYDERIRSRKEVQHKNGTSDSIQDSPQIVEKELGT